MLDISMPGMSGIAEETGSPLVVSHRFMKAISSDWDLLIRAPSFRRFTLSVCESISAVISTA
jgi:hypothetical protein